MISNVLSAGGSVLSQTFRYLSGFAFIFGVLAPRSALTLLIVAGFYLDMVKRLLVVEGAFGLLDLIQVLAFAPIAFAGILLGQLFKVFFGKAPFGRSEFVALALSVVMSAAILALTVAKNGFQMRPFAEAGAQAAYVSAVWLAFYHLKTFEQRHRFFTTATCWFIPVVIYAYWQLLYGYSDLEYRYALSGLTINENPLKRGLVEYYRIFSTMSSSGAYGLMAIVLGSYALLVYQPENSAKRTAAIIFGLACYGSLIPGAGRTGWAIIIIIIFGYFMFRSKLATVAIYTATSVLMFTLVTSGDDLIEFGADMVEGKRDGEWTGRALQVGTFTDRTESFANWTSDPKYFSWFGHSASQGKDLHVHDMLGEVFVGYGVVGLFVILLGIFYVLTISHMIIFKTENIKEKRFAAFILAVIFGLLLGSIVSGGGIRIFPANFYFWHCVGILFVMRTQLRARKVSGRQDVQAQMPSESTPLFQA